MQRTVRVGVEYLGGEIIDEWHEAEIVSRYRSLRLKGLYGKPLIDSLLRAKWPTQPKAIRIRFFEDDKREEIEIPYVATNCVQQAFLEHGDKGDRLHRGARKSKRLVPST